MDEVAKLKAELTELRYQIVKLAGTEAWHNGYWNQPMEGITLELASKPGRNNPCSDQYEAGKAYRAKKDQEARKTVSS